MLDVITLSCPGQPPCVVCIMTAKTCITKNVPDFHQMHSTTSTKPLKFVGCARNANLKFVPCKCNMLKLVFHRVIVPVQITDISYNLVVYPNQV